MFKVYYIYVLCKCNISSKYNLIIHTIISNIMNAIITMSIKVAGLRKGDVVQVINIENGFPIVDRRITICKPDHNPVILHNQHVKLIQDRVN